MKRIGSTTWTHRDALDAQGRARALLVEKTFSLHPSQWNVLKFDRRKNAVSLLRYERFDQDAAPMLCCGWRLDLKTGRTSSWVSRGDNPPVLHRKELLLDAHDPRVGPWTARTRRWKAEGLFSDPSRIGTLRGHEKALAARRNPEVCRHCTAIKRHKLSAPMQALERRGLLDGRYSVFDYGCGRGDDVRALRSRGVSASGFDPHFSPHAPKTPADIVNLGFVVNVIEDREERARVLREAFSLARGLLVVSSLLCSPSKRGRRYGDGILTSRGTFQRCYAHETLGRWIFDTLGVRPVSAGSGVYFVFKR